MEVNNIGSELIRISPVVKNRLDKIRDGKTVKGRWGYERQMKYTDVIVELLDNDWASSAEKSILGIVRILVEHEIWSPNTTDPYKLLNLVVDYLQLWLERASLSRHPRDYPIYKEIYDLLSAKLEVLSSKSSCR